MISDANPGGEVDIHYGRDKFGYRATDSNAPADGPTYDWIEISGDGTEVLTATDDEYVSNIPLGFFFNYYGTDYSQLAISNNGLLFSGAGSTEYVNEPIKQSPSVHGFIAPFWDDLVTWGSAGSVYYETIGTEPNRKFVVEWKDNQHYDSSTEGITFEAILYEGSNNIQFQYLDTTFGTVTGSTPSDLPPYDNGGSATVGIEGPDGNDGLEYSYNNEIINPGLAILFKFPQFAGTNLYLSKQAPASKDRGSTMTYTIHYHNFGDTAAQNVVLIDTLPNEVEFSSSSDGGSYDPSTRKVTWNIGSVAANGHGYRTVTVSIPESVAVGASIQNDASISTSNLEVRYDDNSANAQTTVTGSNLPPNVGVEPNLGGTTPSVYWNTPITFSYYNPTATSVGIRIHVDDGGPDITGSMINGPPDWTYTTSFYPRHGRATITYTVDDPTPFFADFDLRNMRGFENTITATEIENYIRSVTPSSPILAEAGIGQRFINAGRDNHVNPAFLVATAQHEGVFGTQGWAAAHPDAHNTMGWGIYPGHMDEDWEGLDRNAFASWGDGITHVAWRIGAPDGPYYGAGLYTVSEIRTSYAGDPAISTIVHYMNDLATFAGQAGEFSENFDIYIDPAGYIYDTDTNERIEGASVWLQRPDGFGGWENVPTGQTPPIMQPDENPLITGVDGQYQWDVLEGSYRVHVEASGYYPADSVVVSIPPPVTDLHVGLVAIPPPNTPYIPAGPSSGLPGSCYSYSTSATDPDGHQVKYTFDWGDGSIAVSSLVDSGTSASASHIWNTAGSYSVKAMVTDSNGLTSGWSEVLTVTISSNNPPNTPSIPSGPISGSPGASYGYSTSATDPDGDQVKYTFDWGDGTTQTETNLVDSGTTEIATHAWSTAGTYLVKAMATDSKDATSEWSEVLTVTISSNNPPNTPSIPTGRTIGVHGIIVFNATFLR